MSADLVIVLTAGLVATARGLLGPFLVLRNAGAARPRTAPPPLTQYPLAQQP